MKTLAIDYGKRNIGLAVSDEIGIIATKLPSLVVKSDAELLSKLKKINNIHKVQQILIGIPAKGQMREEILNFTSELEALLNIEVKTWNEDFSSIQSEKGTSKKFKKEKSHSEVARTLLQEYLDSEVATQDIK